MVAPRAAAPRVSSHPFGNVLRVTQARGAARWSIEQVVALAPSPSRYAAAEAIAVPSRWSGLGADERTAWGSCRGTGREPYDTMVDHVRVAWRCSCPSRSQPCKHALALLAMWVRGHVPEAPAPAVAAAWADGNARRAHADEGSSAPASTASTTPSAGDAELGAQLDEAVPGDDDGRDELHRGRNERIAKLLDGLVELDRWLDDRLRTGLSDPVLARYATWDTLAARLTDACAGALANRVRRLAGVVGARPDWHEVVLAEFGVLHLLASAGRRLPELPERLGDAVATACGWQVRQADVLAGVPDTDEWVVAGRSDTREDRIEVRRTWLRGRSSGRWAMVLSFAAYRQSLDATLVPGHVLHADLHRYPGPSVRALVGTVHGRKDGAVAPQSGSVSHACASIGSALAAEPWSDRVPATALVTPMRDGRRWTLGDDTGTLAIAPGVPGLATLLAASAGRPVDVTFEWTVDGAVPLAVHLADRCVDIGPLADPSFVSAA